MKTAAPPIIIFAACSCFAQSPVAPPAFEVAVIKPSPVVSGQSGMMNGVRIDKAQVSISSLSLSTVLAMAFRVQPYQIAGPGWLTTTAFNISAKLPIGASVDQVPEMLQALLADRFKMTAHREDREQPVYALVAAKSGLKLKEKDVAEGQDSAPQEAGTVLTPIGEMKVSRDAKGAALSGAGVRITMNQDGVRFEFSQIGKLVQALSADVGRPVLDQTNLKGNYQIEFGISQSQPMSHRPGEAPDPVSENPMFTALRELGLVVESQKAPVETIVIDRMEKAPTEN